MTSTLLVILMVGGSCLAAGLVIGFLIGRWSRRGMQ